MSLTVPSAAGLPPVVSATFTPPGTPVTSGGVGARAMSVRSYEAGVRSYEAGVAVTFVMSAVVRDRSLGAEL
ncbi:hypothetical protein OK074_4482 [Actinobacteria bacterium OK074]|nr:hypothetical protein OK074_4482 [Actinobacteria bacterium OK074]